MRRDVTPSAAATASCFGTSLTHISATALSTISTVSDKPGGGPEGFLVQASWRARSSASSSARMSSPRRRRDASDAARRIAAWLSSTRRSCVQKDLGTDGPPRAACSSRAANSVMVSSLIPQRRRRTGRRRRLHRVVLGERLPRRSRGSRVTTRLRAPGPSRQRPRASARVSRRRSGPRSW